MNIPNITILKLLGQGSHGSVYLAENRLLSKYVALKVLQKSFQEDATFKARFLQEGQILCKLDHPNILKVYSSGIVGTDKDEAIQSTESPGSDDKETESSSSNSKIDSDQGAIDTALEPGAPYLVMEYVEGLSIAEMVLKNGPFSIHTACRIIAQVADALHAAHQMNIVHRDVKPSNIIVDTAKGIPFLLDFGLGKVISEQGAQRLTATSQLIGTPAFMSPEQSRGEPVSPYSDQYSLACVFYFMCTGKQLFTGSSDLELMLKHSKEEPDVSELSGASQELKRVLLTALSKNEADRHSDITEFGKRLQKAASGKESRKGQDKVRHLKLVILLVVLLLAAVFGFQWLEQKKRFDSASREASNSVRSKKLDLADYRKACDDLRNPEKAKSAFAALITLLDSDMCKKDINTRVVVLGSLAASTGDPKLGIEWAREEFQLVNSPQFTQLEGRDSAIQKACLDFLLNAQSLNIQFESTGPQAIRDEILGVVREMEKSTKNLDEPAKTFLVLYFKSFFFEKLKLNNQALEAEQSAMLLLKEIEPSDYFVTKFFIEIAHLRLDNDPRCSIFDMRDSLCSYLKQKGQENMLTFEDFRMVVLFRDLLEFSIREPKLRSIEGKKFIDKVLKFAAPKSESPESQLAILDRFCRAFLTAHDKTINKAALMNLDWALYFKDRFPPVVKKLKLESNSETARLVQEDTMIISGRLTELGRARDANNFLKEMQAASHRKF